MKKSLKKKLLSILTVTCITAMSSLNVFAAATDSGYISGSGIHCSCGVIMADTYAIQSTQTTSSCAVTAKVTFTYQVTRVLHSVTSNNSSYSTLVSTQANSGDPSSISYSATGTSNAYASGGSWQGNTYVKY